MKKIFFIIFIFSLILSAKVYENAEDGKIDRWKFRAGSEVFNIYDTEKKSRVIKFHSDSYKYYRIKINNSTAKEVKWDMKLTKGFYVYIMLTTSKRKLSLYYSFISINYGLTGSGIHYGLGKDSIDGTWHTYRRDVEADLKRFDPDNHLISIDGIMIRAKGDFYIDNIELFGKKNNDRDITPPNIVLNGDSEITLKQNDEYIEQGAIATDNIDGNLSVTIIGNVDTSKIGHYTLTYKATDSAGNSNTVERIIHITPIRENIVIGAKEVSSTPISRGTIFISPDGSGDDCTQSEPCSFSRLDLFSRNKIDIKAGDVVFFMGGIYSYRVDGVRRIYLKGGTATKPVIYESFPGEKAIFDGSLIPRDDTALEEWREGRFHLREDYTIVRNIEIRNMPQYGIRIFSNHNIVEGCYIHNNNLSGVEIFNLTDGYSIKDTGGSYNIVRNNIIMRNSDVGLMHHNYDDGGNADGISIHSGVGNKILNNTVSNNSDDGIDTWKSMDTLIEYNLVSENGKGSKGDGNGIKLGGTVPTSPLGANAVAKYNISYSNRYIGFNINSGKNVIIEYNTSYNNKKFGYTVAHDTIFNYNISYENREGDFSWARGKEAISNSWQIEGNLEFISLDPSSIDFLKPIEGSIFESIGAYGSLWY